MAEALEVSQRTIYRDIVALQAMRLPIDGEAGVGYLLRAGFDPPPLMFTEDEIEAIVVGLALLGRTRDKGLVRSAGSAAAKIAEVLPEGAQQPAPLRVSRWTRIPDSCIEASSLRRHIREEAELKITYLDLKNRRTRRRIKPIALIYYIDAVLLAAWCDLRQAFRHFRLDRIEDCRATGQRFQGERDALVKRWERESELP